MTPQEIITAIQHLPLTEQQQLRAELIRSWEIPAPPDEEEQREAEVVRLLLARGLIREVPSGLTDEEEDFEPVAFEGPPISQTIIAERR